MKASRKVFAAFAIGAAVIIGMFVVERSPRRISGVVEGAFGYRLKEKAEIVSRKYEVPFSVHGVSYSEDTTLRLSPTDYRGLLDHLTADHRYEKEKFGTNEFYERFVVGKELISWQAHDVTHEFWFSYTEYWMKTSPNQPSLPIRPSVTPRAFARVAPAILMAGW
jgi:hypothetical protein